MTGGLYIMGESVRDDTARRVLIELIGILAGNRAIGEKDYMILKSELGYERL